jgi:hypothetical protein
MDNLPTRDAAYASSPSLATKNCRGNFYGKILSSNERDGCHFTAGGPLSKARPGRNSYSNNGCAFIPLLLTLLSPPCMSTLPCELDLSHAAPEPTPCGPPSLSSHAYAASPCHTKLIDIAADNAIEDATLFEMATSHDKYQAEI